jgi:hypothetical protein
MKIAFGFHRTKKETLEGKLLNIGGIFRHTMKKDLKNE